MKLFIKRLSEGAKIPTRGTAEAACFDLYVSQDTILPREEPVLVPTGIAMGIPPGYCAKVYGRSSMHKKGVIVQTGIIDSDYTGEIKVQTLNNSPLKREGFLRPSTDFSTRSDPA